MREGKGQGTQNLTKTRATHNNHHPHNQPTSDHKHKTQGQPAALHTTQIPAHSTTPSLSTFKNSSNTQGQPAPAKPSAALNKASKPFLRRILDLPKIPSFLLLNNEQYYFFSDSHQSAIRVLHAH